MNTTANHLNEVLAMRPATAGDREALARLAQLDSAPAIGIRNVLVAELDGEIVAALPLESGDAIANPFRPTAGIVALLEARRGELHAQRRPRHRRPLGLLRPLLAEG